MPLAHCHCVQVAVEATAREKAARIREEQEAAAAAAAARQAAELAAKRDTIMQQRAQELAPKKSLRVGAWGVTRPALLAAPASRPTCHCPCCSGH
jgi:hypothetical protein